MGGSLTSAMGIGAWDMIRTPPLWRPDRPTEQKSGQGVFLLRAAQNAREALGLSMSARKSFMVLMAAVIVAGSSFWISKRHHRVAPTAAFHVSQDLASNVTAYRGQGATIRPAAGPEWATLIEWQKLWDQHQNLRNDP